MTERQSSPTELVANSSTEEKAPPVIIQADRLARMANGGITSAITQENFPDLAPGEIMDARYFSHTNRIGRIELMLKQNPDNPVVTALLTNLKKRLTDQRTNELEESLKKELGSPNLESAISNPINNSRTGQYL